jgi:hypothetical protein
MRLALGIVAFVFAPGSVIAAPQPVYSGLPPEARRNAGAVGMIVAREKPPGTWGRIQRATGFLVQPSLSDSTSALVLTNQHVARDMAGQYSVELELPGEATSARARVTGILLQEPALDYALLRVRFPERAPATVVPLESAKPQPGPIYVIGFPHVAADRHPQTIAVGQVKSGKIRQKVGADFQGRMSVRYDAASAQGSSGSPVIARDTGRAVALHWSTGRKPNRAEAIPMALVLGDVAAKVGLLAGADRADVAALLVASGSPTPNPRATEGARPIDPFATIRDY